jgi:glycosyltransferase involved in cell wall biosynthesis
VPVIATRSGGPEEIIEDGVTGCLVPVKDPHAIVRAIEALKAPATREQIVQNARSRAQERFSLDSMLHGYLTIYRRLAAGGPQ